MPERGLRLLRDLYQAEIEKAAKERIERDPECKRFRFYPSPLFRVLGYAPNEKVYKVIV